MLIKMKNVSPKNHHYVPRIYLKQFAENGEVVILNIIKVKLGLYEIPHKAYPANICSEEHFYTIEENASNQSFGLNKLETYSIETTMLHRLETKYPKLLEKLTTQTTINIAEETDIVDFMLMLKLRNPYHLSHTITNNQSSWVNNVLVDILQNDEQLSGLSSETNEKLHERLKGFAASPEYAKGLLLNSLAARNNPEMKANEWVRQAVLNSSWAVWEIPQGGPRFITLR
jgi:hypothetical protein